MPEGYLGEDPNIPTTNLQALGVVNNHYEEDAAWCTEEEDEDLVEQPSHYAQYFIEPITYIERNGFSFWRGNIIKYASRAGSKIYPGKTDNESEILDLQKVIRYAQIRINLLNGETKL